ncbi:N-acetyltransferase B complex, non-catalytic subunit [Kalmanozyma brasiliensis GHG001]|uniref:Actin cytoskeleton organization protein n=1 Tax=Kalmanozyma brasiliensis (strain GHG001) TaxID=1365824 RepID=V5EAD5_KALBG|nr:N-acetyltransferase B complex, non-catalytic subunit [Kalmanozyma brasiliensis GHG001]EST07356.1 N-acetyltransferase B complex, non-catalytic subunit [Kalmanozyma brasiliensis GHG001]
MNAGFNPIAMLAERACGPIYNAIDTGNNSLAIRHADKVLQSQPDLALALSLKALALVRSGKREEANTLCTKLVTRGLRNGEDNALNPLTWTLGRLGRNADEITLLEAAVKNSPNDEGLARQTYFALVKNQAFQKAQQLATKMHKSFTGRNKAKGRFVEEYFWWSVLSYLLLSRDPTAPGAALALPLSQRMIEKQIESKPLGVNDEEALCLLLQVLIRQGKKKEAFDLIAAEGSVGHTLCDRNLSLEFTRTDLAKELNNWAFVETSCWARIDAGSRNWAHFTGFLDAAEKLGKDHLVAAKKKTNMLLSVKGATMDRSIRLAELEVLKKRSSNGDRDAAAQLTPKVISYFDQFASKACCHEDLLPFLTVLSTEARESVSDKLKEKARPLSIKNELDLRTNISIAKITRTVQPATTLTEESEAELAAELLKQYLDGLTVGASLPETEMQPADDLALLGVQALLSAYRLSHGKLVYLHQVIALLEFALTKSKKGYQLRMLLVRSYILAGAFDRASIHYGLIGLKSVQADTLSYLISERCAPFSAVGSSSNTVDDGLYKMAVRTLSTSQAIYEENRSSTPDMISKAFEHGIYSRVEEFVEFGEALERSLQRQVLRLEESRSHLHNRQNFKSEQQKQSFEAGIEKAVLAVKADLEKGVHDQRDFSVLVNYQPLDTPDVAELTQVGPRQDAGWVRCIASTMSDKVNDSISEVDMHSLTAAEKALVTLVRGARSGTLDSAGLISMLESTKATLRALVDLATSNTVDNTRTIRPIDAIHEAGLTLEAIYHTRSSLTDSEATATVKTHVAEIATLVNHLSRSVQTVVVTASNVLEQGLASLGKDKVAQMMQTTQKNLAGSSVKVLGNLRDALRDAL